MQSMLSRYTKMGKADGKALSPIWFEGADPGNGMDQVLILHLVAVDQEAPVQLKVRKLGAARYEIDGRRVTMRWKPGSGTQGAAELVLLAREDHEGGAKLGEEVPLEVYLRSAANVASSLAGPGAAAVARIPQEKRLTFGGCSASVDSSALENMDVLQRCESMRKACEEAKLREWAAEAYEHGVAWPSVLQTPLLAAAMRQPRSQHAEHAVDAWVESI